MVFVRGLVVVIEAVCRLVVAVLERLGASPVVHRLVHILVQAAAYILTELLRIESVQQALAETITAGMNCFLRQPNMEEHLLQLADTMSRTQPELARKQGRDFPVLVGNFLQGMLSPNRDTNTKPTKQPQPQQPQSTPSTTELMIQDEPACSSSSRGSSPGISPLPRTLSIPNLLKTWSQETPEDGASAASKRRFYNNYHDHGGTITTTTSAQQRRSDRSWDDAAAHSEPCNDAALLSSTSTMLGVDGVEDGSFHFYRYGPTGVGSSGSGGGISSSFSTVEQKKIR